jgi:hypothetical protein
MQLANRLSGRRQGNTAAPDHKQANTRKSSTTAHALSSLNISAWVYEDINES